MTRDEIIAIVQEAICGCPNKNPFDFQLKTLPQIERFAALIQEATLEKNNLTWVANCQHLVNAEREACAQVCEAWGAWLGDGQLVAAAIRARSPRSG